MEKKSGTSMVEHECTKLQIKKVKGGREHFIYASAQGCIEKNTLNLK